MAVTSERVNTRISLTDYDLKQMCSFSGINPEIEADDIVMFVEGVNGLRATKTGFTFLVKENELTETE